MPKQLLVTSLILASISALGSSNTPNPFVVSAVGVSKIANPESEPIDLDPLRVNHAATDVKTSAANAAANAAADPSAIDSLSDYFVVAPVTLATDAATQEADSKAAQTPVTGQGVDQHPYVVARELLAKYEGMEIRIVDRHLNSWLVKALEKRDMSDFNKAMVYSLVVKHYLTDQVASIVALCAGEYYGLNDIQRAFIQSIVEAPRGVFDFVCETGQRLQAAQSTALASLKWREGDDGVLLKPLISIIAQYTQEPLSFGLSVAQIMADPQARNVGAYQDLFNPEVRVLNLSRGMITSCKGLDLNGPVTALVLDHNPIQTISVAHLPRGLERLQFDSQRQMIFDNGADGMITRPQVVEISASNLRRDSNILQVMSRCFPNVRALQVGHSRYQYPPQMLEWWPHLESLSFPQGLLKPLADRKKAREAREKGQQ